MKRTPLQNLTRALNRFERRLKRLLRPRWLRRVLKRTSKSLNKTEAKVLQATRKATKNVAQSSIGQGAQKAKKRSRQLSRNLTSIFVAFAKLFVAIGQLLVPRSARIALRRMGRWILKRFGFVFQFIGRWLRTRNWRLLIGGTPAIVLSAVLAVFLVRIPLHGKQTKIRIYERAASKAMSEKDAAAVELYQRRLAQLGGMRHATAFKAALYAFEKGNRKEAIEKMQALAPLHGEGFGYGPAHSTLARWILAGEIKLPDDKKYRIAEAHVKKAIEQNENDPWARLARAELYRQTGRTRYAISDLESVQRKVPSLGLGLVELYLAQGEPEKAMKALQDVDRYYTQRHESGAELEPLGYVFWAHAKMMLGDREAAERLFAEGTSLHADDEEFRRIAVRFFIVMADLTQGPTEESANRSLQHIRNGLTLEKDNRELLGKLLDMAKGNSPAARLAKEELKRLQSLPDAPKILSAMIGTLAAEEGDYEKALPLLLKGAKDNPTDALALNNAAWVQLQVELKKPPQARTELDNALNLVEQALQLEPNRAIFHETKGQILLAKGDTRGAIAELEFSLNGLERPDPAIHEALAKAYAELNNLETARMHSNAATRLRGIQLSN